MDEVPCDYCTPEGPERGLLVSVHREKLVLCAHEKGSALSYREGWYLTMTLELYPYWCYRICGPGKLDFSNPIFYRKTMCAICAGSPFSDYHTSTIHAEVALQVFATRLTWLYDEVSREPIDREALRRQEEIKRILAGVSGAG